MNEPLSIPSLSLTQREKEILSLVARGYSSKQIAHQLKISDNTVSNHRKNMLARNAAKSSAELVFLYNSSSEIKNSH
ncbi:MAG: hypothetical protein JSS76_03765 [Bacteroidetes bacterium]|nr:hypothetical protein [Bacteroidota bacterium]